MLLDATLVEQERHWITRGGGPGITISDRCGSSKHNTKGQVALNSRADADSWHSIGSLFYAIYLQSLV